MTKNSKRNRVAKASFTNKRSVSYTKRPVVNRKSLRDIKSISYQDYLIESLKDPKEAAGYLNAALLGGDIKVFLLALQNVIQAQGGISVLAKRTHKSRTSLYKSLSEEGNPYLKSANDLLTAMNMHFIVVPNKRTSSRQTGRSHL